MVTVVFEHVHGAEPEQKRTPEGPPAAARAALRGRAEPGSRLMDLCDELAAPVPFSCRDASCGSCLVQVCGGEALLAPADDVERRTLLKLGAAADQRLACRAVLSRTELSRTEQGGVSDVLTIRPAPAPEG